MTILAACGDRQAEPVDHAESGMAQNRLERLEGKEIDVLMPMAFAGQPFLRVVDLADEIFMRDFEIEKIVPDFIAAATCSREARG